EASPPVPVGGERRSRARLQRKRTLIASRLWRVDRGDLPGWSIFTSRSVVSPNFELGRRCTTKDFVVDRHRTEGPLVSGGGLRSRLSSRLHGSDHPFGVVWAILPVEDDLRDVHVSALDGELHVLDVFLDPFRVFGSDPDAWIGGLDRLLAEHEPLVF